MAVQINIAEAKAKLSSLLDRALDGEEIVIARAGKPLVRLTPVDSMTRRKPGAWRGLKISNDALFEPMSPEDLDAAEGKQSDEFGITNSMLVRTVRLLLDTHALLWWLIDDPQLSAAARSAIASLENDVLISACSGYEIAYKQGLGRLPTFPETLLDRVRRERMGTLPISLEHAVAAAALPGPHRDPWDRIMMAQAVAEHCHVVTVDRVFADYNVPVFW